MSAEVVPFPRKIPAAYHSEHAALVALAMATPPHLAPQALDALNAIISAGEASAGQATRRC